MRRGPLGNIRRATLHPRIVPTQARLEARIVNAQARSKNESKQREKRRIKQRVLRQWTRIMIAEGTVE